MKLRLNQLVVIGCILFLAFPVAAQVNWESEMEVARSYAEADRKTVLAANLDFSEEENAIFWPVHKEYRYSVNLTNDRLVKLIKKFADNYDNLSDEMAADNESPFDNFWKNKHPFSLISERFCPGISCI